MLLCSSKTGSSPQHKRSSYNRNMTSSLSLLHGDGVKVLIASKTYHCRAPRDLIATSIVLVYTTIASSRTSSLRCASKRAVLCCRMLCFVCAGQCFEAFVGR
jgi:hypothetical protein